MMLMSLAKEKKIVQQEKSKKSHQAVTSAACTQFNKILTAV